MEERPYDLVCSWMSTCTITWDVSFILMRTSLIFVGSTSICSCLFPCGMAFWEFVFLIWSKTEGERRREKKEEEEKRGAVLSISPTIIQFSHGDGKIISQYHYTFTLITITCKFKQGIPKTYVLITVKRVANAGIKLIAS